MRTIFLALGGLIVVSACSPESTINPFGWFGNDTPAVQSDIVAGGRALPLVAAIEEAEAAPTRQGVIIRATGLAPTQGHYNARLVPASAEPPEGNVLTLVFLAEPPEPALPGGPAASRRLMAALFLHDSDLPQVSRIRIESAGNAVTVQW